MIVMNALGNYIVSSKLLYFCFYYIFKRFFSLLVVALGKTIVILTGKKKNLVQTNISLV